MASFPEPVFHGDEDMSSDTPQHAEVETLGACPSGVFVDGQCCMDSGFHVPVVGGGPKGFYTTYSAVFLLVGLILFAGVLLPINAAVGDSVWEHPAFVYGLLPVIAASGINSCDVFVGSQAMLAHEYRLWNKTDDHRDITVSADVMTNTLWKNFLWHTVPMVLAALMLAALTKLGKLKGEQVGGVIGATVGWLAALALVWAMTPVSKETKLATSFDVSGEEEKEEAEEATGREMVVAVDKVDVVYGDGKVPAVVTVLGLNAVGAVLMGFLMQQ